MAKKIHPVKNDPQAIGSAITYARRYAIGAILGLNIENDDDGNAGSTPSKQGNNKANQPQQNNNTANDKPWLNENTDNWRNCVKYLKTGGLIGEIEKKYRISKPNREKLIADASK